MSRCRILRPEKANYTVHLHLPWMRWLISKVIPKLGRGFLFIVPDDTRYSALGIVPDKSNRNELLESLAFENYLDVVTALREKNIPLHSEGDR